MTAPRPRIVAAAALVAVALAVPSLGADDRVFLRDGRSEAGRVLGEQGEHYVFSPRFGGTRLVSRESVRFVVYGDPAEARTRLGLDDLRARCPDPAPASVDLLPADAFGDALATAIRGAQKSVYMMTYYVSGSRSGRIAEIYDAMRERAADGVRVVLLLPGGPRTAPGVRIATENIAETFTDAGIDVRFLTGPELQHKKLVIVDGTTVLLGSSNLTGAGVSDNIEWNLVTHQPAFVSEALDDFRSMRRRARKPVRDR